MKMFTHGIAGALVFLVLTLPSQAADREPSTEKEFLAKAISTDINEVKLGELALKNASSDDLKTFARKMVTDHTKHRDQLQERARAYKLAVVQGLEKEYQDNLDRLTKLNASEFDREYMKCMVEGHEKALKMYESWSKKIDDRDLRSLVEQTIPKLKEHLEQSREVFNKVKR